MTLLAACGLLATLIAAPVGAEPSSDEVRADLQNAEERLQDLQMQAAEAVEDYNEAQVALETLEAELAATEQERNQLGDEVAELSDAAAEHARRLHKLGPTLELSPVMIAGDSSELGARTAALGRILDGQRADLEGLSAAQVSLDTAEERLEGQYEETRAHTAEVETARERVESVLADQQNEITALEADLDQAEDREAREAAEEERRRQEAEAEAAREAEQQAQQEQQEQEQQQASEAAATESTSTGGGTTGDGGTTDGGGTTGTGGETTSSADPAPDARQSAQVAVDTALAQVGKPYQFGAGGPNAFDCSGLTSYAWRAAGVDITRTSRSQWQATTRVSRGELQPGDLVFYSRDGTPGGIGHVSMYIGGGQIVEASRPGVPVRTTGVERSDILGYGRP